MKRRNVILVAAAATLSGTLALAGGWARGTGLGPYGALGLSAEQTAKMEALTAECREEGAPLRDQLIQAKQELRGLWSASELDSAAISAKQAEVRGIQEKMQAVRLQCETDRRAVLTAEQKAKLTELGPGGGCGGWGRGGCGGVGTGCGGQAGACDGTGPGEGQGWGPRARRF
ncbi:MAG: Spy/CpxP family protein refolding chaperone [Deltaproteobacteria bacterium]|nr:Spy/CpxP family protein refolding chaperone [Deltaproteobacteria bacterium]